MKYVPSCTPEGLVVYRRGGCHAWRRKGSALVRLVEAELGLTGGLVETELGLTGGSAINVSGEDISKMEEGGSLGELKFIGNDTCWQLRTEEENSLFRSFSLPVMSMRLLIRRR